MDKPPTQNQDLGGLYPKAKTYDEIEQERLRVKQAHQAKQPKHTFLQLSIGLALIPTIMYAAVMNPNIFVIGNIVSGVFFIFLFVLLFVAYFLWQLHQAGDFFYHRGLRSGAFVFPWTGIVISLAFLANRFIGAFVIAAIAILLGSFIVAFGLMKIIVSVSLSVRAKLSLITAIMVASFVSVVVAVIAS